MSNDQEWSFDLLNQDVSQKSRQQLTIWLGACSAWVFSLVAIGGVTRLTRSGLSMTDWKFTGKTSKLIILDLYPLPNMLL